MSRTLALLVIGAVLVGTGGPRLVASLQSAPNTAGQDSDPSLSYVTLIDGDVDGAIQVFRQIEQAEAESPLGYVLEADSDWEG